VVNKLYSPEAAVDIAMVGKYINLTEAYKSLSEALLHAGINTKTKVNIHYFDSEDVDTALTKLSNNGCQSRGEEENSGWNW
jgi:CTP synthase